MIIPLRKDTGVSLIVLLVISAVVIWVRTLTVKETYSYVRQEKELRKAEHELQGTRLKLVKLTGPSRLQNKAEELGLTAPHLHQVVKWERFNQGRPRP